MGSAGTAAAPITAPRVGNRKTYTVSKATEKWTDGEHDAFVRALETRGACLSAQVRGGSCMRSSCAASPCCSNMITARDLPHPSGAGRNWKAIVQDIGTRTVAQVRCGCHAEPPANMRAAVESVDAVQAVANFPPCCRVQVRSHAQKYFLRLEKEGRGQEIPEPRPKKRASHPYPTAQPRAAYAAYATAPPSKIKKICRGWFGR